MSKGGKLSVFLAVSYFYPRLGAKFDCAKLIRGSMDISGLLSDLDGSRRQKWTH